MDRITEAKQCVGGDMLAWVSYPLDGPRCFVHPQFLYSSEEWKTIEPDAFPNNGSFLGMLRGGSSPSDMQERYGSIVVARINANDFELCTSYDPSRTTSAQFSAPINPNFQRGMSVLEFDAFSSTPLSARLVQIVSIEENVSFLKPFTEPVTVSADTHDVVCRTIVVRHSSGKLFGPFDYSNKDERTIELIAPSFNDYRIAPIDSIKEDDYLYLKDDRGTRIATFIEKHIVDEAVSNVPEESILDWMPEAELRGIITRAINASDRFANLNKTQLREIKSAVWDYSESSSQVSLDDARRQRIINLLSGVEDWVELPDIVSSFVSSIDKDALAEIVCDNRYFPLLKEKIMESAAVQESIEEEKRRLEASLAEIRQERDKAKEEQLEAEQAAKEAKAKAEEANEQLEKVRDEALEQKRSELIDLEKSIEEGKVELKQVKEDYQRAIVEKDHVKREVDEIIAGINDEVSTSSKILESEILRKVVAAVSGVDLRDADQVPIDNYQALRPDEEHMSDDDLVSELYESIAQKAGRQFTKNDVINLMTCLTQGYITTFAGQPGTGKTSLCNTMVGALGLMNNDAGRRFTEINVENGWTSYKDYVGYYNPLAKTYEKANTTVYDAMYQLSMEQDGAPGIPPYIFLLDEANLSPIEHYWSPFLHACDYFQEEGTKLSLGGKEVWRLPNHIRFLATVNFDHTTEALSNRFLDRSWVITLDPEYYDQGLARVNISKLFANEHAFSANKLFATFSYCDNDTIDKDNEQLFNELISICRARNFMVSTRSLLMMRRYIATASRLMDIESKDDRYAPLDYAFSQKVLPLISGPAETVGELVMDLADKCSPLKTAKNQLERMKVFGEDSGFYQYFI